MVGRGSGRALTSPRARRTRRARLGWRTLLESTHRLTAGKPGCSPFTMITDRGRQPVDTKIREVLERIELIEQAMIRAREYLTSGKHAQWSGFRPMFDRKFKDGQELPPHKDWVKNVFLPRKEKALRRAEKVVERLRDSTRKRAASQRP